LCVGCTDAECSLDLVACGVAVGDCHSSLSYFKINGGNST
jgi:hypothetical protein